MSCSIYSRITTIVALMEESTVSYFWLNRVSLLDWLTWQQNYGDWSLVAQSGWPSAINVPPCATCCGWQIIFFLWLNINFIDLSVVIILYVPLGYLEITHFDIFVHNCDWTRNNIWQEVSMLIYMLGIMFSTYTISHNIRLLILRFVVILSLLSIFTEFPSIYILRFCS